MRLIDADELIKKFLNVCRTEFEIKNKCMADENVIALIHNAPTVCNDNYSMGYQDGVRKVLSERPTGKWESPFPVGNITYHKCSNCHISSQLILVTNYCPICGAKMEGAENNES